MFMAPCGDGGEDRFEREPFVGQRVPDAAAVLGTGDHTFGFELGKSRVEEPVGQPRDLSADLSETKRPCRQHFENGSGPTSSDEFDGVLKRRAVLALPVQLRGGGGIGHLLDFRLRHLREEFYAVSALIWFWACSSFVSSRSKPPASISSTSVIPTNPRKVRRCGVPKSMSLPSGTPPDAVTT